MIELKNVNKSFGDLDVLNDISIQFEAGKTNLIIGQSGSGKTVLLKSIIGLHEINNGHIYYGDRDFTKMNFNEKKLIRKEMGMVFQGGALFDSLSVEENVRFPLDMFSDMNEDDKRSRVKFCLDRVDIK